MSFTLMYFKKSRQKENNFQLKLFPTTTKKKHTESLHKKIRVIFDFILWCIKSATYISFKILELAVLYDKSLKSKSNQSYCRWWGESNLSRKLLPNQQPICTEDTLLLLSKLDVYIFFVDYNFKYLNIASSHYQLM